MRTPYFLTILLTLAPVGANGAETITPVPPASVPDSPQKVICVRGLPDTGSHFGASKVCHTESEWLMIHNQSEHTMERFDIESRQKSPEPRR